MYPNYLRRQAHRLHNAGKSSRWIAKHLIPRVARNTITEWLNQPPPQPEPEEPEDEDHYRHREYHRCPTCGYLVTLPCVLCAAMPLYNARLARRRRGKTDPKRRHRRKKPLARQATEPLRCTTGVERHAPRQAASPTSPARHGIEEARPLHRAVVTLAPSNSPEPHRPGEPNSLPQRSIDQWSKSPAP